MEKEALKGLQYTGTKTVYAAPLTRTEAASRLCRNLKSENSDEEEGYLVEYEDGYQSWSPKSTFEKAYQPSDTFVDRMRIELADLHNRIVSLHGFMLTQKYRELSDVEQSMLVRQFTTMHDYHDALANRLDYYNSLVPNGSK